ncbi:uncharacterized protein BDW43DRAFT_282413 [Aspergillus alliaceus]|uniref:uncharacterized protein n=1 Tax=Petromyces alliaceus TaxID=209559 RepID=UPI0012A4B186|nr:uncharacterized protein BDW43DRAFT_282413 [Aspergillus alliaceus]KAB8231483.1 hypothetical protein BDW43DRAFT_282413 [Aspergillus alliaceus]
MSRDDFPVVSPVIGRETSRSSITAPILRVGEKGRYHSLYSSSFLQFRGASQIKGDIWIPNTLIFILILSFFSSLFIFFFWCGRDRI